MGKKNKNKPLLTDLEIKYWLLDQSHRLHCWIIESSIGEILDETNTNNILTFLDLDGKIRDTKFQLKYTYAAQVFDDNLIALVEDASGDYAIIRNKKVHITKYDSDYESDDSYSESNEEEVEGETEAGEGKAEGETEAGEAEGEQENEKAEKGEVDEQETEDEVKQEAGNGETESEAEAEAEAEAGQEAKEKKVKEIIERLESTVTRSSDLKGLLKNLNGNERQHLNILAVKHMKLKPEASTIWTERFPVIFPDLTTESWLSWLYAQKEHLDLVGLFWIKPETFDGLVLKNTSLTLNQNYRLNNFEWLSKAFKSLSVINLINLPQLKNEHIEVICEHIPNLTDFNLHFCSKVNLRLMISLLKHKSLQNVCLNQTNMVCQTNAYATVVADEEIETSESIKKVLITSMNFTMDACEQIFNKLPNLERIVVHPKIFVSLQQNLKQQDPDPGLVNTDIVIASLDKKEWTVKRPFKILNKFRDQAEPLYSESMRSKMKDIEDLDDLENNPELLAEVIAEMKENGEWSSD